MCLPNSNDNFNRKVIFDFSSLKSVRIRSCSGPYFPVFGLNTKRYGVYLGIQSKCRKIPTRATPNTENFHAVSKFPKVSYVKDNEGMDMRIVKVSSD